MTAPTAGPWVAGPHRGGAEWAIRDAKGNFVLVIGDDRRLIPTAEQTRLITAAPDLLAALRECVTDPNSHCITTLTVDALYRRLCAINEIALPVLRAIDTPARAALAKAGAL